MTANQLFDFTAIIHQNRGMDAAFIEFPGYLSLLLEQNPKAKEFFEGLSFTGKKEYIRWIDSAKKEETRSKRMAVFLDRAASKPIVGPNH